MRVLLELLFLMFWGQLGLYVGYGYIAWRVRKLERRR